MKKHSSEHDIDKLIPLATKMYNQDKLPSMERTEDQTRRIVMMMFEYLRKYMIRPYSHSFRLDKLCKFTVRYLHIRNKIRDHIQTARSLRYRLHGEAKYEKYYDWSKEHLENNDIDYLIKRLAEEQYEIRYLWVIKQKYQDSYTKTAKYKRLQKLRALWQEKQLLMKDQILKEREEKKEAKRALILLAKTNKEEAKILKAEQKAENKRKALAKRTFKEDYRREKLVQSKSNKKLKVKDAKENYEVTTEGYKEKRSIHD